MAPANQCPSRRLKPLCLIIDQLFPDKWPVHQCPSSHLSGNCRVMLTVQTNRADIPAWLVFIWHGLALWHDLQFPRCLSSWFCWTYNWFLMQCGEAEGNAVLFFCQANECCTKRCKLLRYCVIRVCVTEPWCMFQKQPEESFDIGYEIRAKRQIIRFCLFVCYQSFSALSQEGATSVKGVPVCTSFSCSRLNLAPAPHRCVEFQNKAGWTTHWRQLGKGVYYVGEEVKIHGSNFGMLRRSLITTYLRLDIVMVRSRYTSTLQYRNHKSFLDRRSQFIAYFS